MGMGIHGFALLLTGRRNAESVLLIAVARVGARLIDLIDARAGIYRDFDRCVQALEQHANGLRRPAFEHHESFLAIMRDRRSDDGLYSAEHDLTAGVDQCFDVHESSAGGHTHAACVSGWVSR